MPLCRAFHIFIKLTGFTRPVGPISKLTLKEKDALQATIDELLGKCFILDSSSLKGPLSPLTGKKYGGIWSYLDHQNINVVTLTNHYAIPPMDQIPTLSKEAVFSEILTYTKFTNFSV